MTPRQRAETTTTEETDTEPASLYGGNGNTAAVTRPDDTTHIIRERASPSTAPTTSVITPSGSVWQQRRRGKQAWQKVRNQRARDAMNLKAPQVAELWKASNFASESGTPLNTWLTVRPDETEPAAYRQWFKRGKEAMARWLKRKTDTSAAYVYVHEAEGGLHFHALVHVPRRLADTFSGKITAWFPAANTDVENSTALRRDGLLRYMSKGAPQQVARKYNGNRRAGGQGRIDFKRSGVAQSIGRKARR